MKFFGNDLIKKHQLVGKDHDGKPVTVRATQEELTLGKDKHLLILFDGLGLKELQARGMKGIVDYLNANELVEKLFDLILDVKGDKKVSELIDLNTVPNSQNIAVLNGFFLLNKASIESVIASFQGKNVKEAVILYLKNWVKSRTGKAHSSQDQKSSTE